MDVMTEPEGQAWSPVEKAHQYRKALNKLAEFDGRFVRRLNQIDVNRIQEITAEHRIIRQEVLSYSTATKAPYIDLSDLRDTVRRIEATLEAT
ncbi:hypothetical protein [Thiohalorhabdus sp.]|uniref:hypothetical protein n=1 Tax=Thiohalorhabdus sp. TaxID=3094134 RepID=UPI002FC3CDDF